MGAALFSGKIVFLGIGVILVFGFATGILHWNRDEVKCFQPKYYTSDRWQTLYSAGRMEVRYRNLSYGCDNEWKFNPDKFEKDATGRISPKQPLTQ